jgi:hypothetical protein
MLGAQLFNATLDFLRSFRKNCRLIRGFNDHLAAADELNRAVARGQVQFECRLVPKEVPDSAVVHREQQVHSVIVLHVVVGDDYWPFRTAVSRPVALFLFPFVNFHVFSSCSVTVSLPAPNLADQLAIRGVIDPARAQLCSRPNRGHTPSAVLRGRQDAT